MSSGCGHNTLGPRLTVGVRDERMEVRMIEAEPAMAAAALASWVVRYSHGCIFDGVRYVLPSQKGRGCFVAGTGHGNGYGISEIKTCWL